LAADIITPRPRWDRAAATRRLRWCGTAAALAAWLTPVARRQIAASLQAAADYVDLGDLTVSRLLAEAGVIGPRPMLAELDRLIAGIPGRLASLETLISTELWLTQQQARTPTSWRAEESAYA
jgi:hypothetical protein